MSTIKVSNKEYFIQDGSAHSFVIDGKRIPVTDKYPSNILRTKNGGALIHIPYGYQEFTSDGTFTVPEGVTEVEITACGGGSGGKGNRSLNGNGSCGGAAILKQRFNVVAGKQLNITVGRGGLGGINTWTAGSATVIGDLITLPGGSNVPGGPGGGGPNEDGIGGKSGSGGLGSNGCWCGGGGGGSGNTFGSGGSAAGGAGGTCFITLKPGQVGNGNGGNGGTGGYGGAGGGITGGSGGSNGSTAGGGGGGSLGAGGGGGGGYWGTDTPGSCGGQGGHGYVLIEWGD